MKLKLVIAILAVAAASVIAIAANSASAAQTRTLTFNTQEEEGNFVLEDLGSKSATPPDIGDVLAFTQTLTSHGHRAGLVHLTAIGTDHTRHLTEAQGTITLAGGTIQFAGLVPQTPRFTLPILAGTGTYAHDHGTITISTPNHTSALTIHLTD